MAGLGAALALARACPGLSLTLLEQAAEFSEVGAGIQLGPNAVRVLRDWGLEGALRACAAFPDDLVVREVEDGRELGRLPLGPRTEQRYGAPYATVHRADLHGLLLRAAQAQAGVHWGLGERVEALDAVPDGGLSVCSSSGHRWPADAVLGCDGVWSRVRALQWQDGPAPFTGHLAYRGMVDMAELPPNLRSQRVSVWLGPRCHVVHYPVSAGTAMNVVAVVHGDSPGDAAYWDHAALAVDLSRALGPLAPALQAVLSRVPAWRLWPLHARVPVAGAADQARGRVALLGDAAHPMRPYLAQGAAMALEDAWALGRLLAATPSGSDGPAEPDWPTLLARWAGARWARNAWVQARSRRNGHIFHAQGPLRWGRNLAMAVLGEGLLDQPRLYQGPQEPC